jgi:hypothetical protein
MAARQPLRLPQSTEIATSGLGSGERQTLSLGLELGAYVILDDRPARRLAAFSWRRSDTALWIASGHFSDELHKQRFFMGQQLREQVVQLAGEGTDAP